MNILLSVSIGSKFVRTDNSVLMRGRELSVGYKVKNSLRSVSPGKLRLRSGLPRTHTAGLASRRTHTTCPPHTFTPMYMFLRVEVLCQG